MAGDVNHEDVFKEVESIMGSWKSSGFDPFVKYPIPEFKPLEKTDYFIVHSENAKVPMILFNWMGPDTRNDIKATYAADVFSYILSQNSSLPYSYMYVSTTDPKTSVEVMVNELNRLISNGFSQKEFNDIRNLFITSNYMKEESTDRLATSLGQADILGNWKMDEEFIDKIQKTTPADMTRVFKKYIHGINWNYLGDEKAADNAKADFTMKVQ